MRLHTILLLLLLLQFSSGATPCDKSFVKGNPADFDFDDGTKELTCKDSKQINIAGNAYDKLKCEPDGWKHSNAPLSPEQNADKDINVECKMKACDKSYIKGISTEFDYPANVLTCKDKSKWIEISGQAGLYQILRCEKDGWKNPNFPLNPVPKPNEELTISCKAKDPPSSDKCVKKLIKGVPEPDFTFDSNKILKCTNNKQIIVDSKPYDELICDEIEGWKNGATTINKAASKDLTIACQAKATAKCAAALITNIQMPNDGKYDNNKLTCTDKKKEIDFNKILYPEVTCDETDGWKSGSKKLGVQADKSFPGSCVVKACHQSLIAGFDDSKMAYDSAHKLTCKETDKAIEYTISSKKKLAESLTCDEASKWKGQANVDTGILATDVITLSCVKKACHEDLIPDSTDLDKTVPKELKCSSSMKLKVDNANYDKLTCDELTGWKDSTGGTAVKQATDRFTVTCHAAAPPVPCSVQPIPGIILAKKTLTCDPNVPAEITYEGTPDECEGFTITCDATNGWTKGTTQFAPASPPLVVTYTKYCEIAAVVDVVYEHSSDGSYAVKCKWPAVMEYTDGSVQTVNDMKCSKDGGWKSVGISKPSIAPLSNLDCKPVCNQHKKAKDPTDADATDEAKWEDGLTDLVERISNGLGKVRFECEKKNIGDNNNAIKMNGKLVNSHLYCDANGGYTDVYGTKLADASDTVKIECVKSLCIKSGGTDLCLALAKEKIPEGYKCEDDPTPFVNTDDSNQLNCKKKNYLKRLYAHKWNPPSFIDEAIVCKENENWYKYGDAEQKAISEILSLHCLQLRCNACKKLEGTELKTYTPGTPSKCAKHTCTNNLWKVKKVDNSEEEYAGEVTCSSKESFDGKWVIDENSASSTPIVDGYCITSVESCTKAAALETACKPEWTGCSTVTLNDDNAITCPDKKKMFYMQRGMTNLDEGAESIKCDKAKGVWTVTKSGGNVELRRGGTVVCADLNPAPTTTTTEKPIPPCELCPNKKADYLKDCDTCEDKDLKLIDNGARCETSVEFKAINEVTFETDNKGRVKGKLTCEKPDYIWKDEKGEAVGKFAVYKQSAINQAKKQDEEARTGIIIGLSVGGTAIVIIIAVIIIWTVVITRRRRVREDEKDEETKRRMLEEGKKRKKQRGDNDEILDEVSVDAPSEIKL